MKRRNLWRCALVISCVLGIALTGSQALSMPPPAQLTPLTVAFSPDERTVACVMSHEVLIFALPSGHLVRRWDRARRDESGRLNGSRECLYAAFSSDGRDLFYNGAGSNGGLIEQWEVSSGRLAAQSDPLPGILWHLSRRPNGQISFLTRQGSEVIGFRWRPGLRPRKAWQASAPAFLSTPAISEDESRLAAAFWDGQKTQIQVWSLPDAKPSIRVEGFFTHLTRLQFSQDGRRLAAGGRGLGITLVREWDLRDGHEEQVLTNYKRSWNIFFDYAPDGNLQLVQPTWPAWEEPPGKWASPNGRLTAFEQSNGPDHRVQVQVVGASGGPISLAFTRPYL